MKTITLLLKSLSVITGLAVYADALPAKYAAVAALVFAAASTLKDLCVKIGDWMDDGKLNGSFDPNKPLPPQAPTVSALVAIGAAALLFTGCQSSPQAVTYQAAATTAVSVDTTMHLWGAYVAAKHPGVAAESQVKSAFEKYQAAMAVVCDAGAIYAAASVNNPADASRASLALTRAIANAQAELSDLQNLVRSFGVKI